MKKVPVYLALVVALSACAHDGQSRYSEQDVGISSIVEFGTIINVREIDITGKNSGAGALAGGALGAGVGSNVGGGNGQAVGIIGGAIVGAIAGAAAEQAMANRKGIEYTITKESGQTVTVAQNLNPEDKVLAKGERVIVQISGSYQRVLPANDLPTEMNRPKGIKFND